MIGSYIKHQNKILISINIFHNLEDELDLEKDEIKT